MLRGLLHILLIASLAICPLVCSRPSGAGEPQRCEHCCGVEATEEDRCATSTADHQSDDDNQRPDRDDPCDGSCSSCICSGAIVKLSSLEEITDSFRTWNDTSLLPPTCPELLAYQVASDAKWNHVLSPNGREVCALLSRFLL
jgi:hypothetical protein